MDPVTCSYPLWEYGNTYTRGYIEFSGALSRSTALFDFEIESNRMSRGRSGLHRTSGKPTFARSGEFTPLASLMARISLCWVYTGLSLHYAVSQPSPTIWNAKLLPAQICSERILVHGMFNRVDNPTRRKAPFHEMLKKFVGHLLLFNNKFIKFLKIYRWFLVIKSYLMIPFWN